MKGNSLDLLGALSISAHYSVEIKYACAHHQGHDFKADDNSL
jgi:hypothetical protein